MRRRSLPSLGNTGEIFFCFFKLRNRGFTISARLYTCIYSARTRYIQYYNTAALANIKEQTGQFFTRIAQRPAAAAECELLLN